MQGNAAAPQAGITSERTRLLAYDVYKVLGAWLALGLAFWFLHAAPLVCDEVQHGPQIMGFQYNLYRLNPNLAMLPGYHLMVAGIGRLLGPHSLTQARGINLAFGAVLIAVYAVLERQRHGSLSLARLLGFVLFPIFLPYYFVIYTDITSLLLVLWALSVALSGRALMASAILAISVCVRQQNVVWALALPAFVYCRECGLRWNREAWLRQLRTAWGYLAVLVLFGLFVWINGGVAIGGKAAQPSGGLYSGNLLFMLLLYGALFFPSIVMNLGATFQTMRRHAWLAAACLIGLLAIYFFVAQPVHPYNRLFLSYFPRNRLLSLLASSLALKTALAVPIVLAACDWLVRAERSPELLLILIFSVLALAPAWLIEPRYMMVPFALLLLYRGPEPASVQWSTNLAYLGLSCVLLFGIQYGLFFL